MHCRFNLCFNSETRTGWSLVIFTVCNLLCFFRYFILLILFYFNLLYFICFPIFIFILLFAVKCVLKYVLVFSSNESWCSSELVQLVDPAFLPVSRNAILQEMAS